jgi:hypothetical protein
MGNLKPVDQWSQIQDRFDAQRGRPTGVASGII